MTDGSMVVVVLFSPAFKGQIRVSNSTKYMNYILNMNVLQQYKLRCSK